MSTFCSGLGPCVDSDRLDVLDVLTPGHGVSEDDHRPVVRDAHLGGDRASRGGVVTGDEDRLDAGVVTGTDDVGSLGPQRIGDPDKPDQLMGGQAGGTCWLAVARPVGDSQHAEPFAGQLEGDAVRLGRLSRLRHEAQHHLG